MQEIFVGNKLNKETEIRVRVTDEEKRIIKEKAKANGMNMSEFARYASLVVGSIETEIVVTTNIKIK